VSSEAIPDKLSVPLASLVNLGVEHWRLSTTLSRVLESAGAGPLRHGLRKIDDFLKQCEIEVRNMTNQPFDAGLAVRVIDTVDDPQLGDGKSVIEETLSPMVLWRGQVVKPADVVTRRGTGRG
jgi:hypothetical protein